MTTNDSTEILESREALWTVKDVAAYLQLSESWVGKRAADGTLPTLRIGRAVRFEPEEIKAWARGDAMNGRVVEMRATTRRPHQ